MLDRDGDSAASDDESDIDIVGQKVRGLAMRTGWNTRTLSMMSIRKIAISRGEFDKLQQHSSLSLRQEFEFGT